MTSNGHPVIRPRLYSPQAGNRLLTSYAVQQPMRNSRVSSGLRKAVTGRSSRLQRPARRHSKAGSSWCESNCTTFQQLSSRWRTGILSECLKNSCRRRLPIHSSMQTEKWNRNYACRRHMACLEPPPRHEARGIKVCNRIISEDANQRRGEPSD